MNKALAETCIYQIIQYIASSISRPSKVPGAREVNKFPLKSLNRNHELSDSYTTEKENEKYSVKALSHEEKIAPLKSDAQTVL